MVTQVFFYIVATRETHRDWLHRLKYLPFFPLIGVGLAVNNARGVLEAFSGLRTEFVRTPKLGVLGSDHSMVRKREKTYTGGRGLYQALFELGLGGYYVWMAAMQLAISPGVAVVTLILSMGLFTMGGATVRAILIGRSAARSRLAPELA